MVPAQSHPTTVRPASLPREPRGALANPVPVVRSGQPPLRAGVLVVPSGAPVAPARRHPGHCQGRPRRRRSRSPAAPDRQQTLPVLCGAPAGASHRPALPRLLDGAVPRRRRLRGLPGGAAGAASPHPRGVRGPEFDTAAGSGPRDSLLPTEPDREPAPLHPARGRHAVTMVGAHRQPAAAPPPARARPGCADPAADVQRQLRGLRSRPAPPGPGVGAPR